MQKALYFIVSSLSQIVLLILVLRFWLPLLGADFRNPIAQAILRLTSPLVIPVRRILPPIGRIDSATLVVAFIVQFVVLLLLSYIHQISPPFSLLLIASVFELLLLSLRMFVFAVFIYIILSWVSPGAYNPLSAVLRYIVEPVLSPFRRAIPNIGGIDISPIFAVICLQALLYILEDLSPLH